MFQDSTKEEQNFIWEQKTNPQELPGGIPSKKEQQKHKPAATLLHTTKMQTWDAWHGGTGPV